MKTNKRKAKLIHINEDDERLLQKAAVKSGHNTLKPFMEHLLHQEALRHRK